MLSARYIVGDAVAYRNRLLKWNTNCLAEAYKLSYIVGSLPLAKNAKHSPSIIHVHVHVCLYVSTCMYNVSVTLCGYRLQQLLGLLHS